MNTHESVLLHEAVTGLAIVPHGIYVDGTFGRGGHSRAILAKLSAHGRLIAIDKDLAAIDYANKHFTADPRFTIVHGTFANVMTIAKEQGIQGKIAGILLDLGVSSPQLDDPARGFSFMQSGPLDMRMDASQRLDAASFVNQASAQEMADVFKEYGEERFALRIARAIVAARGDKPLTTTLELAEIVKAANPKWEKHKHPATRVFQALRIYVNHELNDLTHGLTECVDVLAPGGRLCVISFHSLEDRIVKHFMREAEQGTQPPADIPVRASELITTFKRIGKAIKPSEAEIKENIRSRSAVLRIGEKLA